MYSDRANHIVPSATVELNAKVARLLSEGQDIIKLNIGEPDFPTPDNIKAAAKRAIDENFTRYTPVGGIPELKIAICDKLERDNGLSYLPSEICVGTGAKQVLLESVLVASQEKDEVLLPTPCWVSYESMVDIAGATPVLVPTIEAGSERFHLDIDRLEAAVTGRTRAIIINTPNNPTGVVYGQKELESLVALAQKYDLWIISDEVYEKFLYDDAKHISIASLSKEARDRTITINGCSKTYAMTGWRVGYAAAPQTFIKKLQGLQSHITSGINSIAQKAAVEALNGSQLSVEIMRAAFRERKDAMYRALLHIPGVSCIDAKGAFYLMPDLSAYFGRKHAGWIIKDSFDLSNYFLEEAHVAVVPGDSFRAPGCIRLSYSNSLEKIVEGMSRIEKALSTLL